MREVLGGLSSSHRRQLEKVGKVETLVVAEHFVNQFIKVHVDVSGFSRLVGNNHRGGRRRRHRHRLIQQATHVLAPKLLLLLVLDEALGILLERFLHLVVVSWDHHHGCGEGQHRTRRWRHHRRGGQLLVFRLERCDFLVVAAAHHHVHVRSSSLGGGGDGDSGLGCSGTVNGGVKVEVGFVLRVGLGPHSGSLDLDALNVGDQIDASSEESLVVVAALVQARRQPMRRQQSKTRMECERIMLLNNQGVLTGLPSTTYL